MEPGVPCYKCDHCKGGRYNLCEEMKFFAHYDFDGDLCEYICHAADFCYKLLVFLLLFCQLFIVNFN